ncbi:MAG TPA: flippase-like domain-containing protein, partial [Candidatus Acidoferrales bacterium]|nr:flippase-like domain-containing protein [Candidatus Acidoferrales bacterium]
MNLKLLINLALSVAVSALCLFLAFRNVPFAELTAALDRFDTRWLVPAFLLSITLMVFRVWRWQLELQLLERISFGRLWPVTAVSYMAITLLPVHLGEVVRPWLLSRRSSLSLSTAVGNLVVEKLMDLFC